MAILGPNSAPWAPGTSKSAPPCLVLLGASIWAVFVGNSVISNHFFGFDPSQTSSKNHPNSGPWGPLAGLPGCPQVPRTPWEPSRDHPEGRPGRCKNLQRKSPRESICCEPQHSNCGRLWEVLFFVYMVGTNSYRFQEPGGPPTSRQPSTRSHEHVFGRRRFRW